MVSVVEFNSLTFRQRLHHIVNWVTTPRILPNSAYEQKRTRLLLSFLFIIVCIASINILLWLRFGQVNALTILSWTISIYSYLLAHLFSYQISSYNIIILTSILPYILLIIEPEGLEFLDIIFLTTLAALLASVFTSFRSTIFVLIINLVTVFTTNIILNQTIPILVLPILLPTFTLTGIILIIAYSNDQSFFAETLGSDAQQAGNSLFRQLFDGLPEPIIIHVKSKIIYANAGAARLFGESQANNLLWHLVEEFIPGDNLTDSQVDNKAGELLVRYRGQLKTVTGQSYPVQITAQLIDYRQQLATLMLLHVLEENDESNFQKEIIATAINPIVVTDTDFEDGLHIRFVNPAFCELTGYTEKELIARTPFIFHGPLTKHDPIARDFRAAIENNNKYIAFETTHYRKNGTAYRAEWTTHITYDARNKAKYLISSVKDISNNLNTQKLLQTHIIQQAVVSELGLLSLSINNHRHLLEHAVVMCEQVLEMDNCAIFEYQPENNALSCVAVSHIDCGIEQGQSISAESRSSQIAYALASGEAVISPNLQNETRFQILDSIPDSEFVSALSVIIPGRKRPYGVLSVFSQKTQPEINDQLYFLQAIANILGSFAENHQAHLREREQRQFAEAMRDAAAMINMRLNLSEMLDKLMEYVRQVVPQLESGSIMLWDSAEQGYRFIYTWGIESEANQIVTENIFPLKDFPLMELMIDSHQPMILYDVDDEPRWVRTNEIEKIRSYLGAPIIVQGECIGFFHLNSTQLAAFNETDAQHLQTFADKVGTAIMNTRYAHELEALVKERTEELQKERERIATILGTSGEGIFYSVNQSIAFVNRSLSQIMGYTAAEMIGRSSTMFRPDDLTEQELQKLESTHERVQVGEIIREELRLKRKDGTSIQVGVTVSPAGIELDGSVGSVTILRDISQEKALEKLKSRFIANAAHELRSPITSLNSRMYMINRQPEKADYHLERLGQIVVRMNRLVSDLLDISYIEYGQVTLRPESIILQDVVERIVGILEIEAGLEHLNLSYKLPDEPIHIWADVNRIEQVLTNLIANAIHYTPKGGKVCVICSVDNSQQIVTIRVKDTGDGIPAEHIDNIFEAFYRLDKNMEKKGTGLGLSISREIVELHKGTIRAESEPGKGSTFIVTLPLLEE
jgi:PAS domain S-box-containing protein